VLDTTRILADIASSKTDVEHDRQCDVFRITVAGRLEHSIDEMALEEFEMYNMIDDILN
jgi:hypothetical protein